MTSILAPLELSESQALAALDRRRAIAVTAGAGSGKTRTLTGRYLSLLEEGHPVRSLVAITFTEKAAREMRNRIRNEIAAWHSDLPEGEERRAWDDAFAELDAARIGTIHSLCAAILRTHPAEAGVDPTFQVLEENDAALLRARAVEETLAWAVDDRGCARLFEPLSEHELRQAVGDLLEKRLDSTVAFRSLAGNPLDHWSEQVARWFDARQDVTLWHDALADLAAVRAHQSDDTLEVSRLDVLAAWDEIQAARHSGNWDGVVASLLALRKAVKLGSGRKGNWDVEELEAARSAMRALATQFDEHLSPLLVKTGLSWALDEQLARLLPDLERLFQQALSRYQAMKDDRQALDFDDLEAGAATLLGNHPAIRARWQAETTAVLVDEFQDTNARQREIVKSLAGFGDEGRSSSLFIVGDAKQSIYRFRGADVEVFVDFQREIQAAGGLHIDLDTTYRAHHDLVQALNALLAPILGAEDDGQPLYQVSFAPLKAHRPQPNCRVRSPFLEFHLGIGDDAGEGRAAAAAGLAARLQELRGEGLRWSDMALLFRASSGFSTYEDALERAGIPYLTVAGRGFYDRPEVRDLLNALAAIADPSDDLALAGLLRSPLMGLADVSLYRLRWGVEPARGRMGLWRALHDDATLDGLGPEQAGWARRARTLITNLHDLAGRMTVAGLLKRLLDATHYRAVLRLAGAERAWRNVDKLLADAHRSGLVSVSDFLDYVQSLRDVAARVGEAPGEAGDVVQLMTVHKAKGLEFPIVVMADAAYDRPRRQPAFLLDKALGPLLRLSAADGESTRPFAYQLATLEDQAMEEAESRRLLYVAATRAQEKLLVSGYAKASTAKAKMGQLLLRGWLKQLGDEAGLDQVRVDDGVQGPQAIELAWHGGAVGCILYPFVEQGEWRRPELVQQPDSTEVPAEGSLLPLPSSWDLALPLPGYGQEGQSDQPTDDRRADPPPRVWRVVPRARRPQGPAWVVGTLVHEALRRWRFPRDGGLEDFLRPYAHESGLTDEREIRGAIAEARRQLARLEADPLHRELDKAERHHELPFDLVVNGVVRRGVVDLLARSRPDAPWRLLDFKTDRVPLGTDLAAFAREKGYEQQVLDYAEALGVLLEKEPLAQIVFLNAGRQVVSLTCQPSTHLERGLGPKLSREFTALKEEEEVSLAELLQGLEEEREETWQQKREDVG